MPTEHNRLHLLRRLNRLRSVEQNAARTKLAAALTERDRAEQLTARCQMLLRGHAPVSSDQNCTALISTLSMRGELHRLAASSEQMQTDAALKVRQAILASAEATKRQHTLAETITRETSRLQVKAEHQAAIGTCIATPSRKGSTLGETR